MWQQNVKRKKCGKPIIGGADNVDQRRANIDQNKYILYHCFFKKSNFYVHIPKKYSFTSSVLKRHYVNSSFRG